MQRLPVLIVGLIPRSPVGDLMSVMGAKQLLLLGFSGTVPKQFQSFSICAGQLRRTFMISVPNLQAHESGGRRGPETGSAPET